MNTTLEQAAGKILLAAIIPGGLAIAGWLHNDMSSIHAAINDLSGQQRATSQQIGDLTTTISDHNAHTDAAISILLADDKNHTAEIASDEAKIEDIRHESPPMLFTPDPQPIPAIGNAIQHLFQPPHHWRGRRP